jgi:hypothetical protein
MSLSSSIHRILTHWSAGMLLCTGAALLAQPGHAATITQSAHFGTGGTLSVPLAPLGSQPFGQDLTDSRDSSGLLTFYRFNSVLGTLTGVSWELVDAGYSFELFHRAEVIPVGVIDRFSMNADAHGRGNIGGTSLLGLSNQSFNLGAGQVSGCDLSGNLPGTPGCGLHTDASNGVGFDSLAANVAAFLGSGSFDEEVSAFVEWHDRIDLAGRGLPPLIGPGPADVAGRFDFSGELRLVYTYTPTVIGHVPEPATLWLAAGLLPLIGQLRRRAGR